MQFMKDLWIKVTFKPKGTNELKSTGVISSSKLEECLSDHIQGFLEKTC